MPYIRGTDLEFISTSDIRESPEFLYHTAQRVLDIVATGGATTIIPVPILNEFPTGTINNTNAVFHTTFNFILGSLCVYLNGLRQSPGAFNDYQETTANSFTFHASPQIGDSIIIDYLKN